MANKPIHKNTLWLFPVKRAIVALVHTWKAWWLLINTGHQIQVGSKCLADK